uniref:Alcohol dehydrogenase-like C-terminal domain-containing protein n=1 Tax=Streptomyces sp. NBC_01401 TaxID=2903854 RepID=A0AAU3GMU1_9ACTN
MLGLDGTLCVLGNPLLTGPKLRDLGAGRKKVTSSGTGGLRQTVEMLDFCAEHGITADVETLPSSEIETALDRLAAGDVRYRFVLDMADLDQGLSGGSCDR